MVSLTTLLNVPIWSSLSLYMAESTSWSIKVSMLQYGNGCPTGVTCNYNDPAVYSCEYMQNLVQNLYFNFISYPTVHECIHNFVTNYRCEYCWPVAPERRNIHRYYVYSNNLSDIMIACDNNSSDIIVFNNN